MEKIATAEISTADRYCDKLQHFISSHLITQELGDKRYYLFHLINNFIYQREHGTLRETSNLPSAEEIRSILNREYFDIENYLVMNTEVEKNALTHAFIGILETISFNEQFFSIPLEERLNKRDRYLSVLVLTDIGQQYLKDAFAPESSSEQLRIFDPAGMEAELDNIRQQAAGEGGGAGLVLKFLTTLANYLPVGYKYYAGNSEKLHQLSVKFYKSVFPNFSFGDEFGNGTIFSDSDLKEIEIAFKGGDPGGSYTSIYTETQDLLSGINLIHSIIDLGTNVNKFQNSDGDAETILGLVKSVNGAFESFFNFSSRFAETTATSKSAKKWAGGFGKIGIFILGPIEFCYKLENAAVAVQEGENKKAWGEFFGALSAAAGTVAPGMVGDLVALGFDFISFGGSMVIPTKFEESFNTWLLYNYFGKEKNALPEDVKNTPNKIAFEWDGKGDNINQQISCWKSMMAPFEFDCSVEEHSEDNYYKQLLISLPIPSFTDNKLFLVFRFLGDDGQDNTDTRHIQQGQPLESGSNQEKAPWFISLFDFNSKSISSISDDWWIIGANYEENEITASSESLGLKYLKFWMKVEGFRDTEMVSSHGIANQYKYLQLMLIDEATFKFIQDSDKEQFTKEEVKRIVVNNTETIYQIKLINWQALPN